MSNIINSEAYVKQGDKVYKVNGGSTIHTFNSVEDMNAANLADGSIACVPSEGNAGGGGLPVVELSQETMGSIFTSGRAELTTAEAKFFVDALTALTPVIVKGNFNGIKFSGVSNIYVGPESENFENYFVADSGNGKFEIRAGGADGEYIGYATIKLE